MSLAICTYGNPILRKKAEPIVNVNDDIRTLADAMLSAMYQEHGVGLAAEQIGRSEAICVIDVPPDADMDEHDVRENPDLEMPLILINPKITGHGEETIIGQEGCLSFPEIYANVERWYEVDFKYTDQNGAPQQAHAKGLVARAVQHELDHLDGVLLVDRMSPVKKVALSGKLKRMAKKSKMAL